MAKTLPFRPKPQKPAPKKGGLTVTLSVQVISPRHSEPPPKGA